MSPSPSSSVVPAQRYGAPPQETLVPRFGDPAHAGMDEDVTAWWVLDISSVRSTIASLAGGGGSPDRLAALLDTVSIVDVDQNNVHLVGPFGNGRQRMINQPVTAYWPPESWPVLVDLIAAAVADVPTGGSRTRAITSIAYTDARLNISTEHDYPDLVFLSVGGTVADQRSLWAVRASEERYRNLIHHLPFALIQVDTTPMLAIFDALRSEGIEDIASYLDITPDLAKHANDIVRVTDANAQAVLLLGANGADQLIGPVEFLFAAVPETGLRVITAHFERRRSHAEITRVRTFDGHLRDVKLSVAYPTPPDRLDVTLITLEDITDQLRIEAQLRELQAEYSRAARISMLGELATSIAHEVNQPLSAIVTNAETSLRWLARPEPNLEKVSQLTKRTAESGRQASYIVQRIRGMAASHAPERIALDLSMIVDEALMFVRHEIESRSIDLSVRLARQLPPVLGDRVQLQQVVVNLLLNAVQAIGTSGLTKGRIDLRTDHDGDDAVGFAIRDSGPGIASENLDRIFGSFFTTKQDGMGIGLAICESIIAAHGGTIAGSNHPEGGALFRFSLPAVVRP